MLFLKVLLFFRVAEYGLAYQIPFISSCCAFGEYVDLDISSTWNKQTVPGCRQLHNSIKSINRNKTTTEFPYNSIRNSQETRFTKIALESGISNARFETIGFPNCTSNSPKYFTNADDIWFRITKNKLEVELGLWGGSEPMWIKLPQPTYCLDKGLNDKTNDELSDLALVLCPYDVRDYNDYVMTRYFIGATDLLSLIIASSIVVIYWILRKHQNVVGWLIFCICLTSVLVLGLSGTLHIINASWIDVERTATCVALYTTLRYLFVVLALTNLLANLHIYLTFWRMMFRVEPVDRSVDKIKIYLPIIILLPALILAADQIMAKMYQGSPLVKETHFAYARCSLPETKFYDHSLTIIVVLTLITVIASGLVILRLRLRSKKLLSSSSQKQFVEQSLLLLKLLLGSGAPILVRFLVFLCLKEHEPSWYSTAVFGLTGILHTLYFFFAFGATKSNIRKLKLIMGSNLPNSGSGPRFL